MILTECPRDALQGWPHWIPTEDKVAYLNALLRVGFDVLDFGSFVSPKAIPQMRDTPEVLARLADSPTRLLAIVANLRGAREASAHPRIHFLGFPLSLSETFQQRNTNSSIAEAFLEVAQIQELCQRSGKELVTYLSMGFGNPYGDPYSPESIAQFVGQLQKLGIRHISLADTVGTATPELIRQVIPSILAEFPQVSFGAHLHARPEQALAKIAAVWESGCYRIDATLAGMGGCPMAKDDLTGNIATETLLDYFTQQGIPHSLNLAYLSEAKAILQRIAPV